MTSMAEMMQNRMPQLAGMREWVYGRVWEWGSAGFG
jgi:hypothetical protein